MCAKAMTEERYSPGEILGGELKQSEVTTYSHTHTPHTHCVHTHTERIILITHICFSLKKENGDLSTVDPCLRPMTARSPHRQPQ